MRIFLTGATGVMVYRGDAFPEAYHGNIFVGEVANNLVYRARLDPKGLGWSAVRAEKDREFLASTHSWFRPVNLATGPDGALYIADFCRAWVEHPAFVPERSRSSVDFREGFNHGRIWRIAPRDAKPGALPPWPGGLDTAGLVALLATALSVYKPRGRTGYG